MALKTPHPSSLSHPLSTHWVSADRPATMTNISVSWQTTKVTQGDVVTGRNVYFLTLFVNSHANLFCRIPVIQSVGISATECFRKLNEMLGNGTAVGLRTDTINMIHNHVMNKQKYRRGHAMHPWLTTLVGVISVIGTHWWALGKSQVDDRATNNCLHCVLMNITCVHSSTL